MDDHLNAIFRSGIEIAHGILDEVKLPSSERRLRLVSFARAEIRAGSSFWLNTFEGNPPRAFGLQIDDPNLIVAATGREFVLAFCEELSDSDRTSLLRLGVAHIALGHIRLGDTFFHADLAQSRRDGAKLRLWDQQALQSLDGH